MTATAALAFIGCNKTEDLGPENLTIDSEPSIEMAQAGETVTIKLISTIDWSLQGYDTDTQAWLSISPESGKASKNVQTITIKALANTETDRTASIVFYGNVLHKAPLTITQPGQKGDGVKLTVADFIKKADTANEYELTGTVSGFNSTYCSFDLTDETGTIYVYSVTNKTDWVDKIKNGGTVTLKGTYALYAAKNQSEVVNATIESFTAGATPDYESAVSKTVAEFLAAANKTTYFKLTGTVSNFNATYCSFDLTDASGSVYVYSVENKSDWSSKIANGGTIVLAGKYDYYTNTTDDSKSKAEVIEAHIFSFEAGETPDYGKAEAKTIKEFIAAADKTTYFKLTGTISNYNATQCRFDLTDDSGSIYVYSVTDASDWSDKLSAGGTVVLAGKYDYYETDSKHEVVEAYILSFEPGDAPSITLAHPLTSGVTWTVDSGQKSSDVKVKINGTEYSAFKLGTSSVAGVITLTIPATAKKLNFYATGWSSKAGVVEIVSGDTVIKSITAPTNSGANNNTPFTYETLTDDANYFSVDISAVTGVTSLTVRSTTAGPRVIIFGVNAE